MAQQNDQQINMAQPKTPEQELQPLDQNQQPTTQQPATPGQESYLEGQGLPEITEEDRKRADEIKERIDRDVKEHPGWGKGPGADTNIGTGDYAHQGPTNDLGTDQYTNSM
ncbi:MAG TPA: hypothetical protein VKV40_19755 [Ktedonobacteraceae bacterium]|nr:hypothetical protein [Ktedonobacteraceae bacterium]